MMGMGAHFTRVDIEAVLTLFGETVARRRWNGKKERERKRRIKLAPDEYGYHAFCLFGGTHLILKVTMSSTTTCVTYLDSFFSSMPFLCSVAMKSVRARDMRNCSSMVRDANTKGPCEMSKGGE